MTLVYSWAMRSPHAAPLALLGLVACAEPATSVIETGLTAEERRLRLELIRDAAAEMGVHNAALLAGIAVSETNLAHCWSEATFACQGPPSPSCDGGPIIAGSADGPCAEPPEDHPQLQRSKPASQLDAGVHQVLDLTGFTCAQVIGRQRERRSDDIHPPAVERAQVERREEPFVRVDDHRVGALGAGEHVSM